MAFPSSPLTDDIYVSASGTEYIYTALGTWVVNGTTQNASTIKASYESNANTNAFTDADETKLDGIEALADVTDAANVALAGAMFDMVDDTTPQLGGHLDGQGYDITKLGTLSMTEQAAANADVAGDGQIWVKTATPNQLWFTDDAGTDTQLGVGGGGGAGGSSGAKIYTSSGTWTKPDDLVEIRVWALGGGGAGGGAVSTSTNNGQAGNQGALSYKTIAAASLGATETVTVGAAGAKGAVGANNGGDGGDSTLGSHLTGTGGPGGLHGTHANRTVPTATVYATGGDVNFTGKWCGNGAVIHETPLYRTTTGLDEACPYVVQFVGVGGNLTDWNVALNTNGLDASTVYPKWPFSYPGGGANGLTMDLQGGDGFQGLIVIQEVF